MEMNSGEDRENQESTSSIEQYEDFYIDHDVSLHDKHFIPNTQDGEMVDTESREYEAIDKDHVNFHEREIISNDIQVENIKHPNQKYNPTTFSPSSLCKCRSTVVKPFKCGLCWNAYNTICQLHEHLEYVHRETELYLFNKITQTAFPRHKRSTVASQTDSEIKHEQREVSVVGRGENEFVDAGLEEPYPRGEFLDSKRESDEQEYSDGNAEEPGESAESNYCSFTSDKLDVLNANKDVHTEVLSTQDDKTFQNDKYNNLCSKNKNKNESCPLQWKDEGSGDLQSKPPHTFTNNAGSGLFKCLDCTLEFTAYNLYILHVKEEHGNQTFCKMCNKQYTSRRGYVRHFYKVHSNPESSHKCDKCDETYPSAYILIRHIKEQHSDEKNVKMCGNCGEGFLKKSRLQSHRKKCLDIKFPCSFENCDKKFRCKTSLKAHLLTHSSELSFVCGVCEKGFKSQRRLIKHMSVHGHKFACTFEHCDKKYSREVTLRAHMMTHRGDNPFTCDECGKGFTRRAHVTEHMLYKHSGERPFKCNQCQWAFYTMRGLSKHKKTHTVTKDQKLQCDVCGKAFSNKWNLAAHVRQHTGEKPFVCEICGAAFIHNVSLKNHMKVHKASDTQNTQS